MKKRDFSIQDIIFSSSSCDIIRWNVDHVAMFNIHIGNQSDHTPAHAYCYRLIVASAHGFQGQGEGRTHTSTCSSPSLVQTVASTTARFVDSDPWDHCIERLAAGPAAALTAAASLEPFAKSRPRPRYMARSSSTAAALKSPPC